MPKVLEQTMTRTTLAYLIIVLLFALAAAVVVLSRRFIAYDRKLRFGNHTAKPVWKPFWMP